MRRLIFLLLSVVSVLLLSDCKKQEEAEMPNSIQEESILLIQPVQTEVPFEAPIDFKWLLNNSDTCRFELSLDSNFTETLVDTLLLSNEYQYTGTIIPNKKCFWRIQQNNNFKQSKFKIQNDAAHFEGLHEVSVLRYFYGGIAPPSDSTYHSQVQILFVDETIKVVESTTGLNKVLQYPTPWWEDEDEIIYWWHGLGTNSVKLTLNLSTDSFKLDFKQGGLGGGSGHLFEGSVIE